MSLGLPRERALAIGGLSHGALDDPDELVDYESLVRLWKELLEAFPSAPLGLRYAAMWSAAGLEPLGVVGYALRHARDGHEAVSLYARFARLADPCLRVAVTSSGAAHTVRVDHEPRVVAMVEPMEMLVLAMVSIAKQLVRDDVGPSLVCFRHAARHPLAHYEALLGGAVPVRFEAAFDGVVFPSAHLDLPLRDADPRMVSYLSRHAEALLARIADTEAPLEEQVRCAIQARLLTGEAQAEPVARSLGLSVRSLQRGLAERSTSFSHEVDHARRERALLLVRRPDLTVAEVAFMLGYADPRVFHRSFRRWTGMTPTAFRHQP
jgi:AraC-like DNA-binding protein